ncbi:ribosome maturation factor RimM [Ectothiorhodospira lacustris]|uniref:ribosome maturation factor RimM n=1 Tax=Ectothiorhodospira lacustris TaxID=2899127 RepID=UPI001EE9A2F8|nr:ribosome maturation factor RimM [Ectothiorhodospira lacustris]MCG5499405.1 ribosome maturation factor RimM [Ectothiorhodospira lacustris]MCG5511290.1 ribosome maturation factor RimM [Ectothiorhodospira lacustris]MCG5523018.1 ribosome maturation factor RimM [Ectothiorhodospira lacustris]
MNRPDWIILGRIAGVYGVKGWVKLFSETEPREGILAYNPLSIQIDGEWRVLSVESGRAHGKGVVAKLTGIDDRDAAAVLVGAPIGIRPEQLEPLPEGEYYWADLVGLEVINLEAVSLGWVDHLMETGANDVLVVSGDRERLIPYVRDQVILEIDLEAGIIRVDWDPDF